MSNTIIISGSNPISIDNFEVRQNPEGKTFFYVARTADKNSPSLFNSSLNQPITSISLGNVPNTSTFVITEGVITNYQYITQAEDQSNEFFYIKEGTVQMKISSSSE